VKNSAPRREDRSNFNFVPSLGISLTNSSSISTPLPLRILMYALEAYMKGSTPCYNSWNTNENHIAKLSSSSIHIPCSPSVALVIIQFQKMQYHCYR
jgi:hypothetical protein